MSQRNRARNQPKAAWKWSETSYDMRNLAWLFLNPQNHRRKHIPWIIPIGAVIAAVFAEIVLSWWLLF